MHWHHLPTEAEAVISRLPPRFFPASCGRMSGPSDRLFTISSRRNSHYSISKVNVKMHKRGWILRGIMLKLVYRYYNRPQAAALGALGITQVAALQLHMVF